MESQEEGEKKNEDAKEGKQEEATDEGEGREDQKRKQTVDGSRHLNMSPGIDDRVNRLNSKSNTVASLRQFLLKWSLFVPREQVETYRIIGTILGFVGRARH